MGLDPITELLYEYYQLMDTLGPPMHIYVQTNCYTSLKHFRLPTDTDEGIVQLVWWVTFHFSHHEL